MSKLVDIKGLTKNYESITALYNVNLELESGHIVGLLGPNGSGKTTLIKILCGLLQPTSGLVQVDGHNIGVETKSVVSYLPDQTYLDGNMTIRDIFALFVDFYRDFDINRAYNMLNVLRINPDAKLKTLSKGNKEKVQLILVMSRRAKLYVLDEPIAGVDPAARDFILNTIISNYDPSATILISTHLISDVESILDDVIFLQYGQIALHASVDEIRSREGKSVDALFREVYRC
ncbi:MULTISPECIES: ABC transporter ATP-binding protein [unclassified Butyrivibrio]|jgi:ABC-2 type transport system ATP-binding protein|uniref:ABC transporter ATP-binding protein n=1 Tax=unclassified Butyrivibrio TaxID=2639466 RepID=UPI00041F3EDF|nr:MULTISPECIES: ABC transporter ATP-binding protein [unclassified Butyrivibrio]